jgi:hypothetical protein
VMARAGAGGKPAPALRESLARHWRRMADACAP